MQATGLCSFLTAGFGKPKDLADVAIETVMSMDHQPGLSHQQAILAGIASVRHVYNQQVSSCILTSVVYLIYRLCILMALMLLNIRSNAPDAGWLDVAMHCFVNMILCKLVLYLLQ